MVVHVRRNICEYLILLSSRIIEYVLYVQETQLNGISSQQISIYKVSSSTFFFANNLQRNLDNIQIHM